MLPTPTSHITGERSPRTWAILTVSVVALTLALGAAASAVDNKKSDPQSGPHFQVGGSIDNAVRVLSYRLSLSDPQEAQLRVLMARRAQLFEEKNSSARETFRGAVDALLSQDQKKVHHWTDAQWWQSDGEGPFGRWGESKWLAEFKDLTEAQRTEFKRAIKQRDDSVWAALVSSQKAYAESLQALLTASQKATLAQIDAGDPMVQIPNK